MAAKTTSLLLISLILVSHFHQTTAFVSLFSLSSLRILISLSSPLTNIQTVRSLLHSLFSRVASLRFSRGDKPGAHRALFIASKLNIVLGIRFWPTLSSVGWDYLCNNAWRDAMSLWDAAGDVSVLVSSPSEFPRLQNDSERADRVDKFVRNVYRVFQSLLNRLLSVFTKSGPMRELLEALQKEVPDDLLKDFLEVASTDFPGILLILRDLSSQYTTSDHKIVNYFGLVRHCIPEENF